MIGLFTMLSAVLWYLIGVLKNLLTQFSGEKKRIPELVYDITIWVVAIGGGMLLAIQFQLDAFVMASQLMEGVIAVPEVLPSLIGSIFGGLLLASGSGVINGLLKAIGKPAVIENNT